MNSSASSEQADWFAIFRAAPRIWAVSGIHADVGRLESIHDAIQRKLKPRDAIIYLGNMIGRGAAMRETIAELLAFRRVFIARQHSFAADLVYLRGSQEEMWQKIQELQFAPNPAMVLEWMLDHGVGPLLVAYEMDPVKGMSACRDGPLAITRWTKALRAAVNASPGHANLLTALRRAAHTVGGEMLFVHAGVDPTKPLLAQQDNFWWGGNGFLEPENAYPGFRKVVRGYDRAHGGLQVTDHAISIDRGCGYGGPLACVCLDLDGQIVESFEA